MATLKEEQCYGLSCGRLSNGSNTSIFHVKLTDSALRAIESYQSSKGSTAHPSIRFTGNQGKISIPHGKTSEEYVTFTFYLSRIGRDNPQGSFDCIQQCATCDGAVELDCLGGIQDKLTVNATDDSYQKARQNMAQAEEETRRRGAIVIKQRGRYISKRVQIRKPPASLTDVVAPSRRVSRPVLISNSSSQRRLGALARPNQEKVAGLPLRERLTHLLALKTYRKAELIVRLQRDGLSPEDRESLDGLLLQVGHLSEKDNTFTLKDALLNDVQRDWPGYTEGDRQLLKRILITKSRKLGQAQSLLSSSATAEETRSPQREQASSSPSQKRPVPDYIDPLANKKPRISHLASRAQAQPNGGLSREREASPVSTATESRLPRLELPQPCEPLSDMSSDSAPNSRDSEGSDATAATTTTSVADRLGHSSAVSTATHPSLPLHPPCQPTAATPTPARKSRKKSRKNKERGRESGRTKDRNRGRERNRESGLTEDRTREGERDAEANVEDTGSGNQGRSPADVNGTYEHSGVATGTLDSEDYLRSYRTIVSHEQRQRYKNEFNVEYNEYRALHARIEGVTRQFTVLETQLKELQQGTNQYKTIHNQILQEYRKIKKSNPNYSQDKNRCEYLHNKLAHIKKTIAKYDHKQL
ncbi:RNA polymerase II elongation factor ELL-like isoform X1 [Clupea harengus]|uniref:RNA polymerase II elongation factor ELL-like isoform X1 n=1 Tax=Clupea harengus TaxID=7950 RepID=A0A6P3W647_CLUHA|nr:RNA polymerase II elongation factor ELL-like isoform X1 [Clupea harengus]